MFFPCEISFEPLDDREDGVGHSAMVISCCEHFQLCAGAASAFV
jgi:hypothetical protein